MSRRTGRPLWPPGAHRLLCLDLLPPPRLHLVLRPTTDMGAHTALQGYKLWLREAASWDHSPLGGRGGAVLAPGQTALKHSRRVRARGSQVTEGPGDRNVWPALAGVSAAYQRASVCSLSRTSDGLHVGGGPEMALGSCARPWGESWWGWGSHPQTPLAEDALCRVRGRRVPGRTS